MLSKTFFTLIFAGCLSVAVAAAWRTPNAVPKNDIGYGSQGSGYINGRLLEGCLVEPDICGLIVW
jgi:hypothetical protein